MGKYKGILWDEGEKKFAEDIAAYLLYIFPSLCVYDTLCLGPYVRIIIRT
jgi:hypothetical protein